MALLSGCSSHNESTQFSSKEVERTEIEASNIEGNEAGEELPLISYGQDSYLKYLIEEAINTNQLIKTALGKIKQGNLEATLNDYENSWSLSSGVSSSHSRQLDHSDNTHNSYSFDFGIEYSLDLFGKKSREKQVYELNNQVLVQDYLSVRNSIAIDVMKEYIALARIKEQQPLLRQLEVLHRELLLIEETQHKVGYSLEVDVIEAKNNLTSMQIDVQSLEDNQKLSVDTIQLLVGKRIDIDFEKIDRIEKLNGPKLNLNELDKLVYMRNDIISSDINMSISSIELELGEINRYPDISFSGSFSTYGEKLFDIFANPIGTLSSSIVFPFIEARKNSVNIEILSTELSNSYLEHEQNILTAVNEINNSLIEVHLSQKEVILQEEQLKLSTTYLHNNESLLTFGFSSQQDVINSQIDVIQSQISLADAKFDVLVNLVEFCSVTDFHGCS